MEQHISDQKLRRVNRHVKELCAFQRPGDIIQLLLDDAITGFDGNNSIGDWLQSQRIYVNLRQPNLGCAGIHQKREIPAERFAVDTASGEGFAHCVCALVMYPGWRISTYCSARNNVNLQLKPANVGGAVARVSGVLGRPGVQLHADDRGLGHGQPL